MQRLKDLIVQLWHLKVWSFPLQGHGNCNVINIRQLQTLLFLNFKIRNLYQSDFFYDMCKFLVQICRANLISWPSPPPVFARGSDGIWFCWGFADAGLWCSGKAAGASGDIRCWQRGIVSGRGRQSQNAQSSRLPLICGVQEELCVCFFYSMGPHRGTPIIRPFPDAGKS